MAKHDQQGPALGLVEVRSVARGMVTVDALVKKAPVVLHAAHPISPGHYIAVFSGGVAEVEESLEEGVRRADDLLVDQVYLPQIHLNVAAGLGGSFVEVVAGEGAIGVLETHTVSATLLAADAACKVALVALVEMRLGQGLGGKAYFVLTGELFDIEAAMDAAAGAIDRDLIVSREIVARPHEEFLAIYR